MKKILGSLWCITIAITAMSQTDSNKVIVRVHRDGRGVMSNPVIVRSGGSRRDSIALKQAKESCKSSAHKSDPSYYLRYIIK